METLDGLTSSQAQVGKGFHAVEFMVIPSGWPSAKGPESKVNWEGLFPP